MSAAKIQRAGDESQKEIFKLYSPARSGCEFAAIHVGSCFWALWGNDRILRWRMGLSSLIVGSAPAAKNFQKDWM